jgi:hypothetical protein
MRGRGPAAGAAAAAKTEYRKTGTDTVGKWTCDKYEGVMNGQKVSEICTVDPKTLGLALSDFEITKQFATFFQSMMPGVSDRAFAIGTAETQGFSGVPVRRTIFLNGQSQGTHEVTAVTRQSFAASSYAVPAGFKKEAGMFGRGGRGGQ